MVGMKGVSFTLPEQEKTNLWIIENTKDGQIYTINEDTKKCDKSKMPINPQNCIPGILIFVGF
jgi:hypothetical protein